MLGAALITKLKFKFYSCRCSMNSLVQKKSPSLQGLKFQLRNFLEMHCHVLVQVQVIEKGLGKSGRHPPASRAPLDSPT